MHPNVNETETPTTILMKLRLRMGDLLKSGLVTPDGFALYQQTMLQLFGEFDRRKQACLDQAQQMRTQAAAVEAQAHAFTAAESLLYAVVNSFLELEEKRLREMAEREAERKANEARQVEPEPATKEAPPEAQIAEMQSVLGHQVAEGVKKRSSRKKMPSGSAPEAPPEPASGDGA